MPFLNLVLDSGIQIRAMQVFQRETYEGGLAIGVHNEERVLRELDVLRSIVQPLIPTCPITVLLPSDLPSRRKWCLPFYTCASWFTSDYVHDSTRMASHLATIHFQDVAQPYFAEENESLLRALDWRAFATDFDY